MRWFEDVRPDDRVVVRLPRGSVSATVAYVVEDRVGRLVGVGVALDRGGPVREVARDVVWPLDPQVDGWNAFKPRVWRHEGGWLFWRGGRRYLLSRSWGEREAWDCVGLFEGPAAARQVAWRCRTRAVAIIQAFQKIATREVVRFHWDGYHPSVHESGVAPACLTMRGFEAWRVSLSTWEISLDGVLVGSVDHVDGGGWRSWMHDCVRRLDDGEDYVLSRVPRTREEAVMTIVEEFPFADDE
ncbi:hypothetical protein OG321_42215 [Streptomyces sp. NBC_00424]|uniref:hypothetical protein n=1 Tax=Streptomyces sp. NBC_00424 TaxID=2903648 RepID=UPI00225313B7|nr:hypothetical protein [Streptomyces sp. NBC_00424]MCX5079013.1 hypothetical protein [Streptomyces sp. NBC_00424]